LRRQASTRISHRRRGRTDRVRPSDHVRRVGLV
jgi:hypothetical protein